MNDFWQNVCACIVFGVVVFAVAYVKKPLSCSANIGHVKEMIKDLPLLSKPITLSKPELINSSSGISYCMTKATTQSGKTIEIPYQIKKEKNGIRVYVDTGDIYNDIMSNVFNSIF